MNSVIIFSYMAYGDYFSYNGLINLLCEYYNKIIYIVHDIDFCKKMYYGNLKVILDGPYNIEKIINNDNKIDILNLEVWTNNENIYKNIHNGNYYDNKNKLGAILNFNIDETIDSNSEGFYVFTGIPKNIRIDKFKCYRDIENENILYNRIIKKYDIGENEKYILICEYDDNLINKTYINTEYKIINLHKLSENMLFLLKLIEKSHEIHLIENSIGLMIYMFHISNNLNYSNNVFFHTYSRKDRSTNYPSYNSLVKMFLYPKLDNWTLIDK